MNWQSEDGSGTDYRWHGKSSQEKNVPNIQGLSGARIASKAALIQQVIRNVGVLLMQNIMTEIGSVLTGNVKTLS